MARTKLQDHFQRPISPTGMTVFVRGSYHLTKVSRAMALETFAEHI